MAYIAALTTLAHLWGTFAGRSKAEGAADFLMADGNPAGFVDRGIMARSMTNVSRSIGRSQRAASLVVAVVVIATGAVALTLIFTAWMGAAATQYTQFGAVRSRGSWSSRQDVGLVVVSRLENVGTTPVAIMDVMLNGKPFGSTGSDVSVLVGTGSVERTLDPEDPSSYVEIRPGEIAHLRIAMPESSVSNGQKLTVGITTSKGLEYEEIVAVD